MASPIQRFPLPQGLYEILLMEGPDHSCKMMYCCTSARQKQARTIVITNLCSQYVLLGFGQEKKVCFMMLATPPSTSTVPFIPYVGGRLFKSSVYFVPLKAEYTHVAIATSPQSVPVHVEEIHPHKEPLDLMTCIRTAWETGYAALKEALLATWGTPHEA